MSLEDAKSYDHDEFGGLCTITAVGDTPPGMSPDTRNSDFFPGGTRSRDGWGAYGTDYSGLIKRLVQYIKPDGTKTKLWHFTNGAIKSEYPEGQLTTIASATASGGTFAQATRPQSVTLFGRQFIALGDGSRGYELPRQWNGTAFSPVAPDGPGAAMTLTYAAPVSPVQGFVTSATSLINMVVCFVTATGYISPPSPVATTTPGVGPAAVTCSNIPLGPSYVTERWIFTSPSDGGIDMYHISGGAMQIRDNTTTSSSAFGYSDSQILNGLRLADYAGRKMPPVAGFVAYGERLISWGALSSIQPILSARADGDPGTDFNRGYLVGLINGRFEGGSTGGVPYNWTRAAAPEDVGSAIVTPGDPVVGTAIRWTGTGTANNTGRLISSTSTTLHDGIETPLLAGRSYGYVIRCRRSSSATGTFRVKASGGNWDVNIATDVGTDWTVIDSGTSASAIINPELSVPNTAALPNGEWFELDWLDIHEQGTPYQRSALFISTPGRPERIDGVISVSPDDGQEIRGAFVLRGNLYVVKERSIHYTKDTGDVPSTWRVDQISSTIGTHSVNCAVVGDSYAVIANSNGVYIFDGAEPKKISQEIDDTWRANTGDLDGWIVVDSEYNRIFVKNGLYTYVCNVFEGFEPGTSNGGHGRKWTLWEHNGDSANQPVTGLRAVRDDGTMAIFIGRQMTANNDVLNSQAATFSASPGTTADPWYHTLGLPSASATGLADPLGGTGAISFTYLGGAHDLMVSGDTSAGYITGTVWARVASGTQLFNVTMRQRGGASGPTYPYTLTSSWQRISAQYIFSGPSEMRFTWSGASTIQLYGWCIETGNSSGTSLDRGYVVANPGPVTSQPTSLVQALTKDQSQPYDSDSAITSYYVCSPDGEPTGRTKFLMATMKIWGSGTLTPYFYRIFPYGGAALATKTILAQPVEDIEVQADLSSQIVQLRFGTTIDVMQLLSARWNVSRASVFGVPDAARFRMIPQ